MEVDSSYYALPAPETVGQWCQRTPPNFVFDVKAYALFTQHPTPLKGLPKDIQEELPTAIRAKANVYLKDVPPPVAQEIWQRFQEALLPLDSAGKLGVVLFQFPEWFVPRRDSYQYLLACREKLPQYTVAVEFRHGTWLAEERQERLFHFLRENGLAYVSVDEPQGFPSSLPPIVQTTSHTAVVRFHGRNRETWRTRGITAAQRFDYIYGEEELREWVPKVKDLREAAREVHVLFNNCYSDKAVTNARDFSHLLTQEGILPPPEESQNML